MTSPGVKPEFRRAGGEILVPIMRHVEHLLQLHPIRVFLLAMLAGAYICFGAMLSVVLSEGIEVKGNANFMTAFGFIGGFSLVILSGAALFTEVNVDLPLYLLHCCVEKAKHPWRAACYWVIVNVGNFTGSLLTAVMLEGANAIEGDAIDRLNVILEKKLKETEDGVQGWFVIVLSAMLGNWMVGMAAINAASARTVIGKIAGIFFPVLIFAALGLQHSPANMGYMFLGLVSESNATNWGQAIGFNIVPSVFGNLIGAFLFVSLPFWYAWDTENYPKNWLFDHKKQDDLQDPQELQMAKMGEEGPGAV